MLSVELQHITVFHVLVDAVEVVDSPGIFGRCLQKVNAEAEVGLVVTEVAEDGGHDVNLLGNGVAHADTHLSRGIVEDDGRAEATEVGLVFLVVGHVGVVGGDGEDGVLEPRLFPGTLEEEAQGVVGIADDLVDG